jgi:hypothetical protein
MYLRRLAKATFILIGLSGTVSCLNQPQELCSTSLVQAEQEVIIALSRLQESENSTDRRIAATDSLPDWPSWSIKQLKVTQKYIDVISVNYLPRRAKDELTEAANQWVQFFGYAKTGRTQKMAETLIKIQKCQKNAKEIVCKSKEI